MLFALGEGSDASKVGDAKSDHSSTKLSYGVDLWLRCGLPALKETNDEESKSRSDTSEQVRGRRDAPVFPPLAHLGRSLFEYSPLPRVSRGHVGVIKEIPQSASHFCLSESSGGKKKKKKSATIHWDFSDRKTRQARWDVTKLLVNQEDSDPDLTVKAEIVGVDPAVSLFALHASQNCFRSAPLLPEK